MLYGKTIQKKSLSAFNDKWYLLNNVESYAYGHFRIRAQNESVEQENTTEVMPMVYQNIVTLNNQSFTMEHAKVTPCILKWLNLYERSLVILSH